MISIMMVLKKPARSALASVVFALAASAGLAQGASPANTTPQIVTHGRGEVDVVPDRGELVIRIETRAVEGGRAAETNAAIVRAVLDTLRRGFRLTDLELATVGYSLQPQMVYTNDGKPPQLAGFVALNSVQARTDQLSRIGAMIDAAVKRGATGIAGISFYSANIDDARRRALGIAVESARRDAEVMAVAAGGRLGSLIELSNEAVDAFRPPPQAMLLMESRAAAVETPVQAGEQKVTVMVTGRWRFVPPSP